MSVVSCSGSKSIAKALVELGGQLIDHDGNASLCDCWIAVLKLHAVEGAAFQVHPRWRLKTRLEVNFKVLVKGGVLSSSCIPSNDSQFRCCLKKVDARPALRRAFLRNPRTCRSLINKAKLFVSLQPNVLPCRLEGKDQDEHNFEAVQSCPEFENKP